jgi:hypothetical protein
MTEEIKHAAHLKFAVGSDSLMYGYGLDDRTIEVRSQAEAKVFFL